MDLPIVSFAMHVLLLVWSIILSLESLVLIAWIWKVEHLGWGRSQVGWKVVLDHRVMRVHALIHGLVYKGLLNLADVLLAYLLVLSTLPLCIWHIYWFFHMIKFMHDLFAILFVFKFIWLWLFVVVDMVVSTEHMLVIVAAIRYSLMVVSVFSQIIYQFSQLIPYCLTKTLDLSLLTTSILIQMQVLYWSWLLLKRLCG